MFGDIKKRFLIYPLVFSALWYILFTKYADAGWVKEINTLFVQPYFEAFGFDIPYLVFIVLFGYIFGYIYGTMSEFLKTRSFNGFTLVVVFFIKCMISSVGAIYGIFAFVIELALLPFVKMLKKKYKKEKQTKKNNQLLEELKQVVREEHAKYHTKSQIKRY
jgi:mannitol-specific phosphotransferase system IIBC component